jgi:trimeric autotransporter adhesin
MIKNILFLTLTFFNFLARAQNFQATYGFANVSSSTGNADPGPFPQVTGLTFGSFLASGVSQNPNASGRFSFTGWPTGATDGENNYGNFTGALSAMAFYQVTLYVDSNLMLDLESLEFSVRRSGTGIRNYSVRSNLDNFTNNLAASTGTNTRLSVIPGDVFFWNFDSISTSNDQYGNKIQFDNQFNQIHDSITFHFYAWNSEVNGGSFSIDNVEFSGVVTNSLTTSMNHMKEESGIEVYPNPAKESLMVKQSGMSKLEVKNIFGHTVYSEIVQNENTPYHSLNVSNFVNGLYFLTVWMGDRPVVKKILLGSDKD